MKGFVIMVSFFIGAMCYCQDTSIIKTILIDDTTESYELFLPSVYNLNDNFPTIFVFDPYGNGKAGIQHFIEDAQRYGYIIIATNNTSNGKYSENFEIASRMMSHALSNYKVDDARIYTAGFSGGSRLASAIAVLTKKVRGVIGCGSAFSQNPQEKPTFESFQYIGIVGTKDMNYLEFKDAEIWLDKFKVDNKLIVFDGQHQWPPKDAIHQAFVWFERNQNDPKTKDALNKDLKLYAETLQSQGHLVEAFNYYAQVESQWTSNDELITLLNQLKNDKTYKTELKTYTNATSKEAAQRVKLIDRFNKDLDNLKLKFWQKEIQKLKELQDSENTQEQHMATRLLNQIGVMAIEKGFVLQQERNFKGLLATAEIGLVLQPQSPNYLYAKALALAELGSKDEAKSMVLDALEREIFNVERYEKSALYRLLKDIED